MPKTHFPRLIHRIWVGPRPIPDRFEQWWRAWADLNPEWSCRHWGDAEVEALMGESGLTDFYARLDRTVLRVDVARLVILWKHGGLYVDADYECRRGIEPVVRAWELTGYRFVVTPEPLKRTRTRVGALRVTNSIAFSEPRHEILKWMLAEASRRVSHALATQDRAPNPIYVTGPALWQDAVTRYAASVYLAPHRLFMPFSEEGPQDGEPAVPADSFALHHFARTWKDGA